MDVMLKEHYHHHHHHGFVSILPAAHGWLHAVTSAIAKYNNQAGVIFTYSGRYPTDEHRIAAASSGQDR